MPQSPAPVLLVDSNPDGLELYSTALALAGIGVETAVSAGDALDHVVANPPRVMVTGLRLRGRPATDLIENVRRRTRDDVYIVGLTTNARLETQPARAAGCDLVLTVPCLPETLVHELRRVL
jgi:two-component system, NtrC family, response regulator GlrR